MNGRQRKAYQTPFIGDPDPMADHGHRAHHDRVLGVPLTVMVTVDVADSAVRHLGLQAAWHVSVSCWPRRSGASDPILVGDYNLIHHLASRRAFAKNVKGVVEQDRRAALMSGTYAQHFYTALSATELEALPQQASDYLGRG